MTDTACKMCGQSDDAHVGCTHCQSATVWEIRIAWTLRAVLVATAVVMIAQGAVFYAVICLFAIALVAVPPILARTSRANLPVELELILLWFVVTDNTGGRVLGLYGTAWFDKALHLGNSVFVGFIGFLIVYVMLFAGRMRAPVWFSAITIFLVSLGFGAVWEIFEYVSDLTLEAGAQSSPIMSPLDDTMWDLILDGGGGILGAAFGPLYLHRSRRSRCRFSAFAHFVLNPVAKPGGAS